MKKSLILLLSILALLLTFTIADLFSIYHFGSIPTLLTSLYLLSIFTIFEYLLIFITYIIRKLLKKDKLKIKKL